MSIFILPQFIEDLKSLDTMRTLGRVLESIFDNKFNLKRNRDDHRYRGIPDAWIRDVSKDTTAYRCIYIQKDENIYLYRAGTKKIEERLTNPDLTISLELADFQIDLRAYVQDFSNLGVLLRSPEPTELLYEILRYKHVALKEIFIVSPVISRDIFIDTNHLGKFINQSLENGTQIILITQPPNNIEEISFFDDLHIKGIFVMYHERVHAKLWYIDIDYSKLNPYEIEEGYQSAAILGSSNLTPEGLALTKDGNNNIELCYRLPIEKNDEFYQYCGTIFQNGTEHTQYKQQKRWR